MYREFSEILGITNCCRGQNYAPAIYGSLRSLYHILLPLHFPPEQGVMFQKYREGKALNAKYTYTVIPTQSYSLKRWTTSPLAGRTGLERGKSQREPSSFGFTSGPVCPPASSGSVLD